MSEVPAELVNGALPRPAQSVTWFVPGRIEVLGKHTDYAGGRSLLAAANRGITFKARRNGEQVVRVTSDATEGVAELPLETQIDGFGGGHWAGYAAAVVTRLVKNFGDQVVGADIEMSTDLPLASGMSSSSAMVVGLARCLMDLSGIESEDLFRRNVGSPEEMAAYLACIENGMSFKELEGHRGVGTFGGSEDHTAMLCGEADALVQYSFCPVRREDVVPFPADHSFVIAVSGVLAEKTGAALELYNRTSRTVSDILSLWNEHTGRQDLFLADAVASSPEAADQLRELVEEGSYQQARLEQFLLESYELVPQAAAALAEGDLDSFGEVVDMSQKWTDEALGNQVPETRSLAASARRLGAVAASAFGAGFGGSVWALVPTEQVDSFTEAWREAYLSEFPEVAERVSFVTTRPGGRLRRLELDLG
ncbi:galactokinase family protein [Boudabousia liubingyangii]|uniref:galactokinase family protein n=1 Tax=Boudabousia liubingyangii TaxID=1921764 RepID=UPI0009FB5AAE|nr:galactokinase family protein [Boudabousia liubingyangii]